MRTRSRILINFILMLYFMLGGCGSTNKNAGMGGLVGAGVGAGTGALVGSLISNGDVAASALMGGAIGLPVGIAMGIILTAYDDEAQEKITQEEFDDNQKIIVQRQQEIEELRRELRDNGPEPFDLDTPRRHIFNGARLGSAI